MASERCSANVTSENIHLEGALAWYDAGFSVIPVLADGTKRPIGTWKQFQEQRATREHVISWFKTTPQCGVGVIMGAVSCHREMFELEGRALTTTTLDKIAAVAERDGILDLWERFFDTGYRELTPSGGIHIIYVISDADVPGNTKIARRPANEEEIAENPRERVKVLAETRGEGGFVVVAPSHGAVHKTGDAWTAVGDCTPQSCNEFTMAERDAIFKVVHEALDEMPETRPAPTAPVGRIRIDSGELMPGQDYNQREDWWTLLTSYGWSFHSNMAGAEQAWTRPGKRPIDGPSATLFYGGSDNLFVFSSSTEMPQETPVDKFAFYTYMEHRGNFSDAARALRAAGYGSQSSGSYVDLSDWFPDDVDPATVPTSSIPVPAEVDELVPTPPKMRAIQEWNETGVAHVMVGRYGQDFRFVHEERGWRVYRDGRWEVSKQAEVRQAAEDATAAAKKWAQHLLDKAVEGGDKDEIQGAKNNLRTANMMRNSKGIKGVTDRFADQRGIATAFEGFDKRTELLCLNNGTFDLKRMVLRDHAAEDMLTRKISVSFDGHAVGTRWEKYLEEVLPDVEYRKFLQRAVGMALLGDTSNAAFFVLHGQTGCGKSTFLEVISAMFGEFGKTAAASTFRASRNGEQGATNNLHDLMGSRLVVTSETAEGAKLDEELIKRITGGDQVTSRQMYQQNITWKPQFTMFMATNFPPTLTAADGAIWRRVKPIHFPNTFYDTDGGTTAELGLSRRIVEAELAGVFNWALEGVRMYRTDGLGEPDALRQQVKEYRQEMDPIHGFLSNTVSDGTLVEDVEASIASNTLFNVYVTWSRNNNMAPMGINKFSRRMEDLGFKSAKGTNGVRMRTGLKLNESMWLGENLRPAPMPVWR